MDALSEVLSSVRITGAIFFHAEFTAPWRTLALAAKEVAPTLSPGTERLVNYHLVTEGRAFARIEGSPDVAVEAGDILIIPHGDAHTMSSLPAGRGPLPPLVDNDMVIAKLRSGDLSVTRSGGGGAATRYVCGFFGCERHATRMFLAGLPPLIKIHIRGDARGDWLEGSIRYLVSDASAASPGRSALLSKMAEALFVETLRRYMDQLSPEQSCWLAGARDPISGGALTVLHRMPWHPWTVATLAAEIGASRSVLAERFTRFLGEPPLKYLARWRLQLAARQLQTTGKGILELAAEVGYTSETAFIRAFKREFGLPPAQYRRKCAARDGPTQPPR